MSMSGQTVLVTGANSGIGKATALALARLGARVILHGRREAAVERARAEVIRESESEKVHTLIADLSSQQQIRAMAESCLSRFDRLHVLINNAGVVLSERRLTEDGIEMTFAVNHLAPFLLTNLLLEGLEASAPARVITVSSEAYRSIKHGLDFDDLQLEKRYSAMEAYHRSKLANILFTRKLAMLVEGRGITANALHPGVVSTQVGADGDLTGVSAWMFRLAKPFMSSPSKGAEASVYLASEPELATVNGAYFLKTRRTEPAATAQDDDSADRLWEESLRLTGLA